MIVDFVGRTNGLAKTGGIVNNELIIDASSSEITIALLEDKQLVELNKEQRNNRFTVGDIFLGRVNKVMPGLNAAFVDVGYEKDAFLHYLDLGPQFASLNDYLKLSLHSANIPPLHNIIPKPDINKNGKINEVLKNNHYVVVQVAKEPISTKGPRLTSEISIAGRYIVVMPFSEKVSVSQKIKSADERKRLKKLILSIKPKNYGVIVRTVAESKNAEILDAELRRLVKKWENSFKNVRKITPPQLMVGELNRASAILRDMLDTSFNNIHVNDSVVMKEIKDYITKIAPEKSKIVKLYNGKIPIFDNFGVDKQIKSLFGKTVSVRTGAYLIIEHTEALHVIDVNSGNRSKSFDNQETNALEVNLVCADEIARQLRLRDIGGIIVVDFIDMQKNENKHKIFERMKEAMAADRTKHSILPLSRFGLMQITRQRVRPEMSIKTKETCPTCGGTGKISPSILFVDDLEKQIEYLASKFNFKKLTIKLHPYVAAFISKGIMPKWWKWTLKHRMRIKIQAIPSYNFFEYTFWDENEEEIII